MTMKRKEPPRVGAVRPSQLMYAFGVGSTIDLPNFSVVVAGLDAWDDTKPGGPDGAAPTRGRQGAAGRPGRRAPVRAVARGDAQRVRRVGLDRRPGGPVPALAALPAMSAARADRLRPVPAQAACLPAGPHPVRPPELHRQGQAAHGRSGALRGRLSSGPPRRVPVGRVRARGHARARGHPSLTAYETGTGARSTDLQVECSTCGRKRHLSHAFGESALRSMPKCRGPPSAPRPLRRELPGAGPGNAARRLEQLVPDHALRAVAPGLRGPDRADRRGALGGALRGRRTARTSTSRSSSRRSSRASRTSTATRCGRRSRRARRARPTVARRSTSRVPSGSCSATRAATSRATSGCRPARVPAGFTGP